MKNLLMLLFLCMLSNIQVGTTTIDPKFQLSFDGFLVFLSELPVLRSRLTKVTETGNALSKRIAAVESGFLKTNKTIATPKEQIVSIRNNINHLDVRLKNITDTVRVTNQIIARLKENSINTAQGRDNLTKLADNVDRDLAEMHDVIDNMTSSVEGLKNTTDSLKSNRSDLLHRFEGLSKKAQVIELLGCDSGFGDVNKAWPQTSTLRFSHPFNATPSAIYSFTRLDIIHGGSYDNNVNVTTTNVTKSGMSVSVGKNSNTQLADSEYNWMACNV